MLAIKLLPVLFGLSACLLIVSMWVLRRFLSFLQTSRTELWQELGSPSVLTNNTLLNNWAVFKLVFWHPPTPITDDVQVLDRIRTLRWLLSIYFLSFAALVIAFGSI